MRVPGSGVPRALILFGDVGIFFLALALTLLLRYGNRIGEGTYLSDHLVPFSFLFIIWLFVFGTAGLYRLKRLSTAGPFLSMLFFTMVVNTALGAVFFYLSPWWTIEPKTNLALVALFTTGLLFPWRLAVTKFSSLETFRKTLVTLGTNEEIAHIRRMVEVAPQAGYRLSEAPLPALPLPSNTPFAIVLGQSMKHDAKMLAYIGKLAVQGMEIFDTMSFAEYLTEQVPMSAIDDRWVLEHLLSERARFSDTVKRASDLIGSILLLPVGIALTPILSCAIFLDDRGPIFFRQRRIGKHGKHFSLFKFRTMILEAEKIGPDWTQEHDARITRVGSFLRRTHLDELPQILNILRGNMSFIGPRPERPELVEVLEKKLPYYGLRHLVRPGLSGWAQVNYRYTTTVDEALEKLQYDLYYIKHRSLLFDLLIAVRSLKLIFGWGSR